MGFLLSHLHPCIKIVDIRANSYPKSHRRRALKKCMTITVISFSLNQNYYVKSAQDPLADPYVMGNSSEAHMATSCASRSRK